MSETFFSSNLYAIIRRPIVTEKTTALAAKLRQYVFEVSRDANKIQLAQAFELAFPGRRVKAVRVIRAPGSLKRYGKASRRSPDRRKAIFCVEGDPLEFFTGV